MSYMLLTEGSANSKNEFHFRNKFGTNYNLKKQ